MINHDLRIIIIATPKVCSTSFSKTFCIPHKHVTMADAKEQYKPYWDSYFKFAFVRNPMDKLISSFDGNREGETAATSLDEVCYKLLHNPLYYRAHGFHPQSHYISHPEELDFIGRYENLEEDWKKVCRHIGFDMPLRRWNASSHRLDRSEYYTPFVCAACARIYAKDFALFGYDYPLPILKD